MSTATLWRNFHLLNAMKDVCSAPFIANCPIVSLDIDVLLGFSWLDVA